MSFQMLFKALSDPNRRKILELLRPGPLTAGEIVRHFNSAGSTISKHLSILKQADLVIDKREGQFIYYELNTSVLDSVIQWLINLEK
ncbi:autorepressor SdpR family transcription factor [Facklamia miroungae]|uniref:Helix-turn-helix domain-containing protein n=1 Tax=Facklamia miroungae TaxID=120956 RepID=A0A1G7UHB7_9LACT|nr:autorepressor SdpR family transcription factor [Facklamia miroungae]NKZ30103.1 winged helix-turn-helix transcriptional regulator [Facklamia miroungae]SDG46942.1 Helix-turn-helix domain-containing protein [Facklamia miroungae]